MPATFDLGVLKIVPIEQIEYDLEKRARGREQYGDISALAKLIETQGLIHPVVVYSPTTEPPYLLVAGGRRILACKYLKMTEVSVRIYTREMNDRELLAIEYYENIGRLALSYDEEVKMRARLHNLLVDIYGTKVARKPDAKGHSARDTARVLGVSPIAVSQDLKLARAMEVLPELNLHGQKNKAAALKLLSRFEHVVANRLAVQAAVRTEHATGSGNPLIDSYVLGDFFNNSLEDGQFSLIECDPPYGINLSYLRKSELGDTQLIEEYVDISGGEYLTFLHKLLKECYRLAALNSYILLWCGPQWQNHAVTALQAAGFQPCNMPAIWKKGNSQGQANALNIHLGSAYEMFVYARKGNAQVHKLGRGNIFDYEGVPGAQRVHPTERPMALMSEILSTFAWPQARVLVPFAGSGNTLVCAHELGMSAVGFDLSREFRDGFVARILRNGSDNAC